MSGLMGPWIMRVIGAAALTWIALFVVPKGPVREVTAMLCGVVLIIVLINPLVGFDYGAFSVNLRRYREEAALAQEVFSDQNDQVTAGIIQAECAAYILDKAQDLGLYGGGALVTAKRGDSGLWYPYEAWLEISGPAVGKESLGRIIESELGIPGQRQYWSGDDDN